MELQLLVAGGCFLRVMFVYFCLNVRLAKGRKWVSQLGILPHVRDPSRLEFSLPLEELGYAHHPWSNPRYSADPLQAILSL